MKKFFYLLLVIVAAIFFGCSMSDGPDTIVLPGRDPNTWETIILPEKESSNGTVPSNVVPNSVKTELEKSGMPINSGTKPPNVSGQYKISNLEPNSSGEGGSGIGSPTELYLDFSKGEKGEYLLSYKESRNGIQSGGKDNVKVNLVGNGSDFTAYFTNDNGQSVVISGTFTNGGISNLYYAVISPNDKSCGCDAYRSFTSESGLAELYEWREPEPGNIPQTIIPPGVKNDIEKSGMPIYSGTTPPDISGQYLANNILLIGSSISGDNLNVAGKYADMYIAFVKGSNGTLSYREKQGSSEAGSDNVRVEVVGTGNNFTAYLETTGESSGIMMRRSTVISGTWTKDGIKNFNYAFVMLEKGYDPNNTLVAVNTYRVFKDSDGLAENYNWLVLSSSSSTLVSSSSVQSSSSVPSSSSAISSSSSKPSSSSSSIKILYDEDVEYGDETYKTVVIGNQIWLARNLNYEIGVSECYNYVDGNCDTYGRLYDWETAMDVCSEVEGWHLPSNEELDKLISSVGGKSNGGAILKATSGWQSSGGGTDNYGFSARPGGSYDYSQNEFLYVGFIGYWWSSTEYEDDSDRAYKMYLGFDSKSVGYVTDDKNSLLSVRCVKD